MDPDISCQNRLCLDGIHHLCDIRGVVLVEVGVEWVVVLK